MPQNTTIYQCPLDPIDALISQSERLFRTDPDRAGSHFLIGLELRRLDFARRRFGARAFDGIYRQSEVHHG